jgi:pimeloyl-ACP methyl ester carboxylesterase
VLVCGCGEPAVGWHLTVAPALVDAGYQVVTFDNRGVAPSPSPPAPYSITALAFEHDVDSPPPRAREAAAAIPDAQFVEIPGASHLGVFTHGDAVVAALLEFFGAAPTIT